jgi:hypothetical protein
MTVRVADAQGHDIELKWFANNIDLDEGSLPVPPYGVPPQAPLAQKGKRGPQNMAWVGVNGGWAVNTRKASPPSVLQQQEPPPLNATHACGSSSSSSSSSSSNFRKPEPQSHPSTLLPCHGPLSKGIGIDKRRVKFVASCYHGKQKCHIGTFATQSEAAKARAQHVAACALCDGVPTRPQPQPPKQCGAAPKYSGRSWPAAIAGQKRARDANTAVPALHSSKCAKGTGARAVAGDETRHVRENGDVKGVQQTASGKFQVIVRSRARGTYGTRKEAEKVARAARAETAAPAAGELTVPDRSEFVSDGHPWLQRRVLRTFGGGAGEAAPQVAVTKMNGHIVAWLPAVGEDQALWHCLHDDGDSEDLDEGEARASLAAEAQCAQAAAAAAAAALAAEEAADCSNMTEREQLKWLVRLEELKCAAAAAAARAAVAVRWDSGEGIGGGAHGGDGGGCAGCGQSRGPGGASPPPHSARQPTRKRRQPAVCTIKSLLEVGLLTAAPAALRVVEKSGREHTAALGADGAITFRNRVYASLSTFAVVALKKKCNGWAEVLDASSGRSCAELREMYIRGAHIPGTIRERACARVEQIMRADRATRGVAARVRQGLSVHQINYASELRSSRSTPIKRGGVKQEMPQRRPSAQTEVPPANDEGKECTSASLLPKASPRCRPDTYFYLRCVASSRPRVLRNGLG